MSDQGKQDQQQDQTGNQPDPAVAAAAAAVERPAYIPEAIWDTEKGAPKVDLAASLAERDALKTAADERAAKIPAKPEDYKFDIPKDFQLPAGTKWEAKPDDPLVVGFREMAVANKWTQDEVSSAVGMYAKVEAAKLEAEQANQTKFANEQTAALGANAGARRAAAKTWIDGTLSKDEAAVFSILLDSKTGTEAVEKIIDKLKGVQSRGNAGGDGPENENSKHAELIGTKGGARQLLDISNAKRA